MKLEYDKAKIKEGIDDGVYDEHGLAKCKEHKGKHRYPSKKMFIDFLSRPEFKNIPGSAEIWSRSDLNEGTETITVEVKYTPGKLTRRDA